MGAMTALTPAECLVIFGEAWFERDRAARIEVLRRCCTEDIVFMDPGLGRLVGLEAVADMIGRFIGERPPSTATESTSSARGRSSGGVSVEVVTPIEEFHGFFRYS